MTGTKTPPTRVCYRCGREAATGARCSCGEPLWLKIDGTDGVDATGRADRTDATRFSWPETSGSSIWRYRDLLPVSRPPGIGSVVGGTPLLRTPRLDDYAGCELRVKDESANPTGSFKDRGSAVGVARALDAGDDWVGTVSHGNMAMSTAATAASAGLNCLVLVPDDIPTERLTHIARHDPTLVRVEGDYGRLYDVSLDLPGVRFVNSDAPLRVAGQKTTALEICEAFADEGRTPDAIVAPVSSGGHASAIWKAVCELRDANLLNAESLPRLYFVQAAACDPIAEAFRNGADRVTPVDGGETVAYSIANASPPSGNRVLAAVRDTGGAVLSVADDAILDAKRQLARRAGLCVEPASATTLAGIRHLSTAGKIDPEESVVAIATGTGFRERSPLAETPESVPIGDLPERVASLVSG
ncbi:threonine synthase [Haladaptatus sp. T7]|uniref:threonine synthase n=1 Tax=Haladaptatus sp. T7 TaxID=2029368 RepID=UPI0021A25419|nr:threonine synthase [Haladaptatus sp. T7]GKZ15828.1 threonine synthase [Haladaptatus sp. T7]